MNRWNDSEALVAYADGQLSAEQAQAVEEALGRDPEARETLRRLREDSAAVRAAFAGVLSEPLPRHIVELIDAPTGGEIVALPARGRRGAGPWFRPWQGMLAASLVALLVGGLVSYLVSAQLIERELARLSGETATASLARERAIAEALESRVSGEAVGWQRADGIAGGSVTPVRTFRIDGGLWCREYLVLDLLPSRSDRRRGIACRNQGGGWTTRALLLEDS